MIATGSPSGLKAKVGGDHLELTVPKPKQRQAGRDLLGSRAEPACTANSRRAFMPMAGHSRRTWRRGPLVFAGTYTHSMTVTTVTPLSTHATRFSGTGTYSDPSYTWTVSGTVNWNRISFSILYTGTNAGYRLWGHGRIAADGSVSGIARDSNKPTLPFTMPAGSASQVLRYGTR